MGRIQFGTSGWRAILAEEFTFANARRAVAAIAAVLAEDGRSGQLVLVGHDTRFLAGRFAAEAARIPSVEGTGLARRLAQHHAAGHAIPAELVADLAAIWPSPTGA